MALPLIAAIPVVVAKVGAFMGKGMMAAGKGLGAGMKGLGGLGRGIGGMGKSMGGGFARAGSFMGRGGGLAQKAATTKAAPTMASRASAAVRPVAQYGSKFLKTQVRRQVMRAGYRAARRELSRRDEESERRGMVRAYRAQAMAASAVAVTSYVLQDSGVSEMLSKRLPGRKPETAPQPKPEVAAPVPPEQMARRQPAAPSPGRGPR